MSGRTYGRRLVTTIARAVVRGTYRRIRAKTLPPRPLAMEAFMSKSAETATRIRELNDNLRSTFTAGQVVMTLGVAVLAEEELTQVLERVRAFDEFT